MKRIAAGSISMKQLPLKWLKGTGQLLHAYLQSVLDYLNTVCHVCMYQQGRSVSMTFCMAYNSAYVARTLNGFNMHIGMYQQMCLMLMVLCVAWTLACTNKVCWVPMVLCGVQIGMYQLILSLQVVKACTRCQN